jgi:hypothetical protein
MAQKHSSTKSSQTLCSQNLSQTQSSHNSALFLPNCQDHIENHETKFSSLADKKMKQAFGVPLLNTEGKRSMGTNMEKSGCFER